MVAAAVTTSWRPSIEIEIQSDALYRDRPHLVERWDKNMLAPMTVGAVLPALNRNPKKKWKSERKSKSEKKYSMENWNRVSTLGKYLRSAPASYTPRRVMSVCSVPRKAKVFALYDKCSHQGGPLSQGLVSGKQVTCPLHGCNIGLEDGPALGPDKGCAAKVACKVEEGQVYLKL